MSSTELSSASISPSFEIFTQEGGDVRLVHPRILDLRESTSKGVEAIISTIGRNPILLTSNCFGEDVGQREKRTLDRTRIEVLLRKQPREEHSMSTNCTILYGDTMTSVDNVLSVLGRPETRVLGAATVLITRTSVKDIRKKLGKLNLLAEQHASQNIDDLRKSASVHVPPAMNFMIDLQMGEGANGSDKARAFGDFLEHELGLSTMWRNLCFLTGQTTVIPRIDFSPFSSTDVVEGSMIRGLPKNYDGRQTRYETDAKWIRLNLGSLRKSKEMCRHVLLHELSHALTVRVPQSELVREAMAELIACLYYELFGGSYYYPSAGAPEISVLAGQMPQCDLSTTSARWDLFHYVMGCAGSAALQQCLGNDVPNRVQNLRLLMNACRPSLGWQGVHDTKVRPHPTFAEWCDLIDETANPGLGTRIKEHPVFQSPKDDSSSTVWMPSSCDPARKSGILLAYKKSRQNSFIEPLPIVARIMDLRTQGTLTIRSEGILQLDPWQLLEFLPPELHPKGWPTTLLISVTFPNDPETTFTRSLKVTGDDTARFRLDKHLTDNPPESLKLLLEDLIQETRVPSAIFTAKANDNSSDSKPFTW